MKNSSWTKWFQPGERSIGLSLTALVIAAVLPLLIFAGGAAWVVISQKKEAIEAELKNTTRALQVAVDVELLHQFDSMQLLATDASLDAGPLADFHEKVQRALLVNKEWGNVILIDPKSHVIVFSGLPMTGAATLTSSGAEVDEVITTRKPKIVGLLPAGKIIHEPIIQFLVPVVRGDEVRFVLGVITYPRSLSDLFAAQRIPLSWTGAVIDSRMMIAGRSRDPQKYVGVRATPTLASRIAASENGLFTALNQEGATVYTVFSRSPQTNWSVVIGIPAGEVDGPIQRMLMLLGGAGAALMVFSLTVTAMVGRAIVLRRNAYEGELNESRSKLQLALTDFQELVTRIPVGIYQLRMSTDGASHFDYVSPRFCEQIGSTQDGVQSDPDSAFRSVAPQDLPELIRQNELARQSLQPFTWEGRVLGPKGLRWMHVESTATLLPDGDILWNGMQFDVTERKHTEDKLGQLSIAVEQSPVSVVITDLNASIEYVNARFTQVTGYSAAEAIGQNPRILKSGLTSKETYEKMWDHLSCGLPWHGEIVNRRKNGECFWESIQIAPVKNRLGVVTHYVAVKSDITERRQMEEEIRQLAFHDALTKLPNRRLLVDRLAQAMAAGERSDTFGALIFLDLDNFKPLNDQHGHGAGDLLLVEVARRLRGCVRAVDTVSRLGGDEFVVVLGDLATDLVQATEQARKLAEKIRVALARPYLLATGNEFETIEHHCSASIGVVLFSKEHQDLENLLKWADTAMYRSKAEGRNRITFMLERRAKQRP
jgi:diguanylate cyclase (GGDEF)-like protein/PAS domain S-box-containing protein